MKEMLEIILRILKFIYNLLQGLATFLTVIESKSLKSFSLKAKAKWERNRRSVIKMCTQFYCWMGFLYATVFQVKVNRLPSTRPSNKWNMEINWSIIKDAPWLAYKKLGSKTDLVAMYSLMIVLIVVPILPQSSSTTTTDVFQNPHYQVIMKFRPAETNEDWSYYIEAQPGDIIEGQIECINVGDQTLRNLKVRSVLPESLQYINGSTVLYNGNHPHGAVATQDGLIDSGMNIGHYLPGANAYIRFSAVVTENGLEAGSNTLVCWSQAGVGEKIIQDYASVNVQMD